MRSLGVGLIFLTILSPVSWVAASTFVQSRVAGAFAADFQIFTDPNTDPGPFLPSGDRVSWAYVATGLVWSNGSFRAWNLSNMGSGVKVAVLDSGVDLTLPDLSGRIAEYQDFTGEGFFDGNGHGTAMTAILASKIDGEGIAGVAPNSTIYAGKVLDSTGFGQDQWIADAIDWAIGRNVRIISMSLAGGCSFLNLTSAAVARALASGITVVAAAANERQPQFPQTTSVLCPAANPGVIAVSSVGEFRTLLSSPDGGTQIDRKLLTRISNSSSRGPEVTLAAPGRNILTWRFGQLQLVSGTSAAAPQVAGVLALMVNRYDEYANLTSRLPQIGRNEFSFKNATDAFYGFGLVNSTDALSPMGDVNGDLVVNDADREIVASAFGCRRGETCYKPAADQNWDGIINVIDLATVGGRFGSRILPTMASVWDIAAMEFAVTFGTPLDRAEPMRYSFSRAFDQITFALSYGNPNIWSFLDESSTTLTLKIQYPDGNTLSVNLLQNPQLTFTANNTAWYYQVSLSTTAAFNEHARITAWKITASSSLGYSHEVPIFIEIFPPEPPGTGCKKTCPK